MEVQLLEQQTLVAVVEVLMALMVETKMVWLVVLELSLFLFQVLFIQVQLQAHQLSLQAAQIPL
jgi:hypothetical protein